MSVLFQGTTNELRSIRVQEAPVDRALNFVEIAVLVLLEPNSDSNRFARSNASYFTHRLRTDTIVGGLPSSLPHTNLASHASLADSSARPNFTCLVCCFRFRLQMSKPRHFVIRALPQSWPLAAN